MARDINTNNMKSKIHYQNLKEKYLTAAKDAKSSGDLVLTEYNMQYAEHYKRIISDKFSDAAQTTEMNEQKEDSVTFSEKPKTRTVKRVYKKSPQLNN